jgi:TRAP-type C4-dicarboxylate transport system permease small subunit
MLENKIRKLSENVLFLLLSVMTVMGFAQVFFRYILREPLPWSEELIRFVFIWSTYIGVPLGVLKGAHSYVDILLRKTKGRVRAQLNRLIIIMEGLVFLVMVKFGLELALQNANQVSPALQVPMVYVMLALPIGGLIGLFACLFRFKQKGVS